MANHKKKRFPNRFEIEEVFLNATSTKIDSWGKMKIILYWNPAPGVVGYNLYRSDKKRPINSTRPITQVNTCDELKAAVQKDSKAWMLLVNAFSSTIVRRAMKVVPDHLRRAKVVDESGFFANRTLMVGSNLERLKPTLIAAKADPCAVIQRGLTEKEQKLFDSLAGANLPIRLARGWAFIDSKVTTGTTYTYELRGVLQNGTEKVLDRNVTIKAGFFMLPQPPSGFGLMAGDSRVLALWNRNNYAFSYVLQRADNPGGPFFNVNDAPIIHDITHDLNNQKLSPQRPGFVDFQRWDEEGLAVSHSVAGIDINGPTNGNTYFYRVASCDLLNRHGNWSNIQSEVPLCVTPPMTPTDFRVDVNTSPFGLLLSWRKVTRDVRHHQIIDNSQTYNIYRAETLDSLDDLASLSAYQIATVSADPTDQTTITLSWLDTDPTLQVPYGEKDFWYRIRCADLHGNESAPSAALSGRLPDITSPGPTQVTFAEGFADHITINWLPNQEPDLAGYQIYRGICDNGRPYRRYLREEKHGQCDFMLVGEVRLREANEKLAQTGQIFFEDFSVPGGSPLCYCYWVRAFDHSGNLYPGDHGCPEENPDDTSMHKEYVCQRLYEETPPPAPIITALKARDGAVQIEWVASPTQDLRAFHIYRSEKENANPEFVDCVLSDGSIHAGRWIGIKPDCGEIPGEANPTAVHGSYVDRSVKASTIYWYRVSALDWLGNESESDDIIRIPAISTFTYERKLPYAPIILPPDEAASSSCGLRVAWTPTFDPSTQKGILVFRSRSEQGNYRQVSPLIKADHFEDHSARRATDYWYRVQAMALDGTLSIPSVPIRYSY